MDSFFIVFPKNIDEVLELLLPVLTRSEKTKIANMDESQLASLLPSLGTFHPQRVPFVGKRSAHCRLQEIRGKKRPCDRRTGHGHYPGALEKPAKRRSFESRQIKITVVDHGTSHICAGVFPFSTTTVFPNRTGQDRTVATIQMIVLKKALSRPLATLLASALAVCLSCASETGSNHRETERRMTEYRVRIDPETGAAISGHLRVAGPDTRYRIIRPEKKTPAPAGAEKPLKTVLRIPEVFESEKIAAKVHIAPLIFLPSTSLLCLLDPPGAETSETASGGKQPDPVGKNAISVVLSVPSAPEVAEIPQVCEVFSESRDEPFVADLEEIIDEHYEASETTFEKKAFERTLQWAPLVEGLSRDYTFVDADAMLAIIKAETQGKTGRQVSRSQAVGLTQIKFQGAWSFLWNALFSETVVNDGRRRKDCHNAFIRARYLPQLQRIREHLEDTGVLVEPDDDSPFAMKVASNRTWEKFTALVNKRYAPREYQVSVDIACLYLDHLFFTFRNYQAKIDSIVAALEKIGPEENARGWHERMALPGPEEELWNSYVEKWEISDTHEEIGGVVERLEALSSISEDPKTCYASYNAGPTRVLKTMETTGKPPLFSIQYADKVQKYRELISRMKGEKEKIAATTIALAATTFPKVQTPRTTIRLSNLQHPE